MARFVRPINLKKPIVNRKLIAWGFVLTGIISLASWAWGKFHSPVEVAASPAPVEEEQDSFWGNLWGPVRITYTVTPKSPAPIGRETISSLQSVLGGASGQYGIYVYRLGDQLGYGIAADKVFPAVSTMKVPIMVATYRKVEAGEIKLEDVEDMLQAIGHVSDNTAPVTLSDMVGRDFVRQTISDLGMDHSDFDENTTTAYDLAQMWKNLYEGKLIGVDSRRQLWEFLTDSIFEQRIPAGVPEGVRVIHKVGTDLDVWADSGIVMADRPFVLVILNSGVNQEEAKQVVPQLVQIIYQAETAAR